MSADKEYAVEEVAKHTSKDDVWLTIHNQVYDVTKYLEEHPGGEPILMGVAGKDATHDYEDVGHSEDAREILSQYLIGRLPATQQVSEKVVFKSYPVPPAPSKQNTNTKPIIFHKDTAIKALAIISTISLGAHFRHRLPHIHLLDSGSSFWNGILLSAAAAGAILSTLTYYFSQTLNIHKDLNHYPAHLKPKYTVQKDNHIVTGFLNPRSYQPLTLSRKLQLSHNVYRFTFSLPHPSDILGLPVGQHVSLRATIDGKVVSRSYTPTSSNKELGEMQLTVKIYPGGKITQYLASLQPGDTVEVRGPKGAMKYHRFLTRHIGMVAGGTGITPMYALIRAVCENDEDGTDISLLYGNQAEEDILMREEMEGFAERWPGKFRMFNVLSKAPEGWMGGEGYVTKEMMREWLPEVGEDSKFLLCGPPPMVGAMRKSLKEMGAREGGAVPRASDQIFEF